MHSSNPRNASVGRRLDRSGVMCGSMWSVHARRIPEGPRPPIMEKVAKMMNDSQERKA
ncbi:hypothetical protein RCH22_001007 [Cryobacterium psychrotolerans]|nr:hypothetical protein [Cryobacterium psychrotolerans]MEC5149287.1 hypothetical protein [Cryobacterium psychrotolerans]MEC5149366.1 hypothetical protein [Cryobacterium psychrotolerans]